MKSIIPCIQDLPSIVADEMHDKNMAFQENWPRTWDSWLAYPRKKRESIFLHIIKISQRWPPFYPFCFLLRGDDPLEMLVVTLKNIYISCQADGRQRFYQVPSLLDLLKIDKTEAIDKPRFLESSCTVQAFMKSLWLLEALTCSHCEDGLTWPTQG